MTGTVSRHELSHFHHASSLSKTPITGRCCYLMSMIDPWSYWTRFRVSPSRRVISPLHPTEYVDLKLFLLILTLIEGKQMAFCIVRFLPLHEQLLCPQPLLSQPRVPQYFLLANLATSPNYQLKHLMQILFHNCFTQEHLELLEIGRLTLITYQVVVLAAITFYNDNTLGVGQFADHFHISSIADLEYNF